MATTMLSWARFPPCRFSSECSTPTYCNTRLVLGADFDGRKDFGIFYKGKWILPSTWLALWNISSPIGAMIGSVFGGWLQDKVGRRRALAYSSFLSAIGVAIMFISYLPADITGRRVAFLMGKLFQGGAIGSVMAASQTYMSEILPPALRGSGMAFFPAFTLLGQLTGALVIYGSLNRHKGYAIVFGSQWLFSFLPILVAFLIPESPTWLVRKRQMDKAYSAQARLDPAGADTKATIDKILRDIEHEEQSAKSTYIECFRSRNFRRTFIVMWANALPAVFGVQLLAKASYFLQLINMKPNTSIVFLILGIVLGLLANIVSIWVMPHFGRRPLIIVTLLISAVIWASMGIANCSTIVPAITWYVLNSGTFCWKLMILKQVDGSLHDGHHRRLRSWRLARVVRCFRGNVITSASRKNPRCRLVCLCSCCHRGRSCSAIRFQS